MANPEVSGHVQTKAGKQQGRDVDKYDNMKKFFERREVIDHINSIIPRMANAQRLLGIALGAIRQNMDLMKCSQASLLAGIVQSLQLGLSLDPALKQAHLVPFWNEKKKMYEATFMPGYQGYLDLARRAGEVTGVSAHCVYKSDNFIIRYGTDKKLEHIPNEDRPEKDPIRGAYVVYSFRSGEKEFDYMTWQDIEKRMAVSKAKASGPWKEWVEEMAVKTVIRHSIKQIGISADLARAAALEEKSLIGESQRELLAIPFGLGEEEEQPEPSVTDQLAQYDELVKANIPDAERPLWASFVEQTAQGNKKTIEETALRIKNDFASALKYYGEWKAATKQPEAAKKEPPKETPAPPAPQQVPPEPGKKKNNPQPPTTPPPQQTFTVKCPNTGDDKDVEEFCKKKCPYSEGCPVL